MTEPQTLFDKVWHTHLVEDETPDTPALLYIDLHLIHELTSHQGFSTLRKKGLELRRPDLTLATMDHGVTTVPGRSARHMKDMAPDAIDQVGALADNCREFGVELYGMDHARQGIVHVIGPELGLSQPGMTIVCGDSHTSTHGALGALAFGIGSTEVGHVLASQCLLQRKPGSMAIEYSGGLASGVSAKDLILYTVGAVGTHGGNGHVIEYRGTAIRSLDMEQRMTVCNMSIEMGARAGMIAPDEVTFEYLQGRPEAPSGTAWERALERWQCLPSDPQAGFDHQYRIDASRITPMITYGTQPGMVLGIDQAVPDVNGDEARGRALDYMGLKAGETLLGKPVDIVFIGSCTNARVTDLRVAASIMAGGKVPPHVRVLVVPGSQAVKAQAEEEGLDRVFTAAGAQWRESGCSMCVAVNQDRAGVGQYVLSTSNRNFEGRQGRGARTFLASPATAAATAVTGAIADPREFQ